MQKKNSNPASPLAQQNTLLLRCYFVICLLFEGAYLAEVFKGNYDWAYYGIFSIFVLMPYFLCDWLYRLDQADKKIKYVWAYGYLILYAFSFLTGQTSVCFTYIFPTYILLCVYLDMRLSIFFAIMAFIINIVQIIVFNARSPYTNVDIVAAEIQLIVLVLVSVDTILVINLHDKLNQEKIAQIAAEKQKAEEERIKAEAASLAKSNFLSNMSHEIRTPINAILGMNEMILREAKDEQLLSYAAMIEKSSNTLLALVNDVLDLSRIESGKTELVNQEYELASIFVDSYNCVAERARQKDLDLTFVADPLLPKYVCGDIVRVRQIFVNILTNAVKYTEKGSIKASLFGKREGENILLHFMVEDTGIGMTKENLEKIFDKFERFDLKRNRTIEGTGLGMSITNELVSLMNGSIEVWSEYGKGSIFTVVLPQKIVGETPIGNINITTSQTKQVSKDISEKWIAPDALVLVVDDVDSNLKVARALLKETQIQVETATGGKEAMRLCEKKKYDCIFMDHMMPQMDGIETFHAMKNSRENRNMDTPIIMLTANALSGEKEKYLAEGFADYLAKPIRGDALTKMLLKHLPPKKVLQKSALATPAQNGGAVPGAGPMAGNRDISPQAGAVLSASAAADAFANNGSFEETASKNGDFFAALPKFYLAEALSYCMGSEDFLLEMLGDFRDNGRYQKIESCFDAADWESYRIEVHALKSTSRTVGFKDLSKMAEALEMAQRNGEIQYILDNHAALMVLFAQTLDALKAL